MLRRNKPNNGVKKLEGNKKETCFLLFEIHLLPSEPTLTYVAITNYTENPRKVDLDIGLEDNSECRLRCH